jgi:hypothetical protein
MGKSACVALAILAVTSCGAQSSSRESKFTSTTAVASRSVTFSMRPVVRTSPPPCVGPLLASTGKPRRCYKLGDPILGLADIESAEATYERNQRQWIVSVTVAIQAAPRFASAMKQNVDRQVAIVVDDQVVLAPKVTTEIGRHFEISGDKMDEATAKRIAAGLTKPQAPDPRQRATACMSTDLESDMGGPPPVPTSYRLGTAGTYWFGRVHLDPPSRDVRATTSSSLAWGNVDMAGSRFRSAVYEVVLAYWTSDAAFVMTSHGKPVPHQHVLAWVFLGTHVPVAASDVSGNATTVPGLRCYFGTSIAAVDATTGQGIAFAYDYSG